MCACKRAVHGIAEIACDLVGVRPCFFLAGAIVGLGVVVSVVRYRR
jgi:hypothetical protein